ASLHLSGSLDSLDGMLKHYSRFAQESASGIGEKYPAAVAIEKSDTDFALEILYLPAECVLRGKTITSPKSSRSTVRGDADHESGLMPIRDSI
ncbi:MAG: hypothetical protein WCC27_19840, partial [Acidobacteriaceae bacterium]